MPEAVERSQRSPKNLTKLKKVLDFCSLNCDIGILRRRSKPESHRHLTAMESNHNWLTRNQLLKSRHLADRLFTLKTSTSVLGEFAGQVSLQEEIERLSPPRQTETVTKETVEMMLVRRLQWHLTAKLQATHYGFTPERGMGDALYDIMTYIYRELNLKKIILMVSLDIEGAFDNAWWPALSTQLRAYKCPMSLYGMVHGCFPNWEVIVRYAGGEWDIQGSIYKTLYTVLHSRSNLLKSHFGPRI
ncbi:hypothetical protein EVAR_60665_1 [Eumeta japonica]|uniref:Reverse transcriptase domain-containing protein n=1 Tax=Eumeta variegata TaxID=151549 RepID=A0A4C1ZX23_EUMVA|nr:hypothetical protein EVAR_60665_1 [Eumeta japonica]